MCGSGSDDSTDCDAHRTTYNRREEGGAAPKEPLDDVTSRTIQTRLLLLIFLVYRLVHFGSVPLAVYRRGLPSTAIVRHTPQQPAIIEPSALEQRQQQQL